MQHSKSLGSFVSPGAHDDTEHLLGHNRLKNRSSLDTFVIPGRVRIPSQKTGTFDEELVQSLLKTSMEHPRGSSTQHKALHRPKHREEPSLLMRSDSSLDWRNENQYGESIYSLSPQPTPRIGSRDNVVNLARRPRQRPLPPKLTHYHSNSPPSPYRGPTFDGAHDSNHESRVTSTTWSTVSKISHRNLSDISGASREILSSRFQQQYNDLATKNGLPALVYPKGKSCVLFVAECADDPQDPTQEGASVKSSTKDRRQNWFARKLMPRNSATITYRARTTYKPIARKKSLSRVSSFTDGGRKNILDGKTLDETCKLGGLGVLTLPKDFTTEKLTLPTCLSAAATYLLQHGTVLQLLRFAWLTFA